MHVRLVAIGDKQPSWVDVAFAEYSSRLPRVWKFRLDELPTAQRSKSSPASTAKEAEGRRLLAAVKPGDFVVLLDESGKALSSRGLCEALAEWQSAGRDLIFVIGGPDGVSADVSERADFTWSLSNMTLPHGFARVMCSEQLYRAWTLSQGHPYHRD